MKGITSITWKKNEVSAHPGKISTAALSEASHPLEQLLVKLAKSQNPVVHFWPALKNHVYSCTWNLELHGSWVVIYHRFGEANYSQTLASSGSLLILTEAEIQTQATHQSIFIIPVSKPVIIFIMFWRNNCDVYPIIQVAKLIIFYLKVVLHFAAVK